jgi:pimeloyl-ACP methyl ester carboxylesterase
MGKNNDQKGLEELDNIESPAFYHSDYRKFVKLSVPYGGNYDKSMLELAFIAFQAPEYSFIDYLRLLDGMNRGGAPLHKGGVIAQYNYIESVPEIKVPVYFFTGRNDYNTPFVLVEEYYNTIKAPVKELVVFEDSAHTPFFSETEKFINELKKILN